MKDLLRDSWTYFKEEKSMRCLLRDGLLHEEMSVQKQSLNMAMSQFADFYLFLRSGL